MPAYITENWLLLVVALVLLFCVAIWLIAANRRTRVDLTPPAKDSPARRNQALIDSPTAVVPTVPPVVTDAIGGAGVAVAAAAAPAPVTGNAAVADDLTRIKGVGPKLADQLRVLGITELSQIAAWNDDDIDRIDVQLGRFQGRIRRDDWRSQAQLLIGGDTTAYEARFGRL
jgi:predicted flap endonuclease-1-like 5' DNA nuclease